jgi:hypothetical protein
LPAADPGKVLQERKDISLVITGGLRVSSDFAKAFAMGADAVAIGTEALSALGCQQDRVCNTGRCPVGIATQDPALPFPWSDPGAFPSNVNDEQCRGKKEKHSTYI